MTGATPEPGSMLCGKTVTVETDLVEDLGYRPSLQFRRSIGDRVTRWLKANNSVGGDKAPMVADLGKGIADAISEVLPLVIGDQVDVNELRAGFGIPSPRP